jgi:chitodextrinase
VKFATGSSGTSDTGTVTTTNANDLLVGAGFVTTLIGGAGTGYTNRVISGDGNILEDRIVTTSGSYGATAALSSPGGWIMQMVAFRSASGGGGGDSQAPTAPTNLTATATSTSQINLSWTASTDNLAVAGYRVERCLGSACTTFTQVATPTTTTFSDTGLAASTAYRYQVRAADAAGNLSAYSSIMTATTQTAPPDTAAPTAPGTLVASAISASQINLTWAASTDNVGVTGYQVERCQGAACSSFAPLAAVTTTSYSSTGLTATTSYSYRVRATDAAGNLSAYSSTASATTATPALISFVQRNNVAPGAATRTTLALVYTAAQVSGDLNVVVVGWNDDTAHVLSLTDTRGNNYRLAVGPTLLPGLGQQSIYYAINGAASAANANSVTVTFDAAIPYIDLRIAEYSGIDATTPVDVFKATTGLSATSDSTAVATTSANDLLVGAGFVTTRISGAGTGYTNRVISSDGNILEDRIVTAIGSYNATSALSPAGGWIMQLVAFRAAAH